MINDEYASKAKVFVKYISSPSEEQIWAISQHDMACLHIKEEKTGRKTYILKSINYNDGSLNPSKEIVEQEHKGEILNQQSLIFGDLLSGISNKGLNVYIDDDGNVHAIAYVVIASNQDEVIVSYSNILKNFCHEDRNKKTYIRVFSHIKHFVDICNAITSNMQKMNYIMPLLTSRYKNVPYGILRKIKQMPARPEGIDNITPKLGLDLKAATIPVVAQSVRFIMDNFDLNVYNCCLSNDSDDMNIFEGELTDIIEHVNKLCGKKWIVKFLEIISISRFKATILGNRIQLDHNRHVYAFFRAIGIDQLLLELLTKCGLRCTGGQEGEVKVNIRDLGGV